MLRRLLMAGHVVTGTLEVAADRVHEIVEPKLRGHELAQLLFRDAHFAARLGLGACDIALTVVELLSDDLSADTSRRSL